MTPLRLRLRDARQEADLSQAELAERADVRIATISDIETGKTGRRIDLDILERLARALGVEPGKLFEMEGKRKR